MKKNILILLAIGGILIASCTKKSSTPSPAATPPPVESSFNGTSYSALSQFTISNANTPFLSLTNPAIASNGSYSAYTFYDNTAQNTYQGFPYSLSLQQINITSSHDTLFSEVDVYSSSPITTGTYAITADTFVYINPPFKTSGTFATAFAYSIPAYYNGTYSDSTTVGSITISKIDTTNNVASGTFNFINYGNYTNGKIPKNTISNGEFTNMKIQRF